MINKTNTNRILSIAPATKGLGFAVIEGKESLVGWGIRNIKGDKNKESLKKMAGLIQEYQPSMLVLEDYAAKSSRRSVRIRKLGRSVINLAKKLNLKAVTIPRKRMQQMYFADGKGTKQELAEILAKRFPEELGSILPENRRAWESESYQMAVFDAVGLVLTQCIKQRKSYHSGAGSVPAV